MASRFFQKIIATLCLLLFMLAGLGTTISIACSDYADVGSVSTGLSMAAYSTHISVVTASEKTFYPTDKTTSPIIKSRTRVKRSAPSLLVLTQLPANNIDGSLAVVSPKHHSDSVLHFSSPALKFLRIIVLLI